MIRSISLLIVLSCILNSKEIPKWTIMHYSAGSNSSERDLMSDVDEMINGKVSDDYNFVLLIDRTEGFSDDSTTLGENFTDTRLFEIKQGAYQRLEGKEFFPKMTYDNNVDLYMGDAHVLKNFITYCKKYYPTEKYMLVIRSHGNGYGMCPDNESEKNDKLYTSELTDVLTSNESIDILGLDVCSMAGIENFFQWRPKTNGFSSNLIIASAPLSAAWDYKSLLSRLDEIKGDKTNYLDPNKMDQNQFGDMIFDEVYKSQTWASWALIDNSKISELKSVIDSASMSLANDNKKVIIEIIQNSLAYYHNTSSNIEDAEMAYPYLDAYDFWWQISSQKELSKSSRELALRVCDLIDSLVLRSYYGIGYLPETEVFSNNQNGIYQIIPMGNKIYSRTKRTYWSHSNWFSPIKQNTLDSYGNYDWCSKGAIAGNNKVEIFYELLDYLFDEVNDSSGGVNGYQY